MKKQILLLVVAIFALNIAMIAQDQQKNASKTQMSPKARAEQMARNLSLTADQQQQVQALFEAQQTKMKELKAAPTSDADARREEMKAMRNNWNTQLEGIIGTENMAKNKAMMVEKAKAAKQKKAAQE